MLPGRILWRAEVKLRKKRLFQRNEQKLCKMVKDGQEVEREREREKESVGAEVTKEPGKDSPQTLSLSREFQTARHHFLPARL